MVGKNTKRKIRVKPGLNFINVSIFTFVYISFSALLINFYYKEIPAKRQILASTDTLGISNEAILESKPIEPYLLDGSVYPVLTSISVKAVDLDSGKALYEKEPEMPVYPASTTKIITALVALDAYPLTQEITLGKVYIDGQKMGLVSGERIKVEDLLYGLLVASANDAAEVLADNYPGGRSMFIVAMNIKAREIGLQNTLFTNPTGLDQVGQQTTADDLLRASIYALEIPKFAEIVATKSITVKSIDTKYVHNLKNINRLLGEVEGVLGVKTGYTEGARENLVTYIERDGKKVMLVVLGSQDRFAETKLLIDWIFTSYNWY